VGIGKIFKKEQTKILWQKWWAKGVLKQNGQGAESTSQGKTTSWAISQGGETKSR